MLPFSKNCTFCSVIEAAISEWKETAPSKAEQEEDIYSVKAEPQGGDEAFEVCSILFTMH